MSKKKILITILISTILSCKNSSGVSSVLSIAASTISLISEFTDNSNNFNSRINQIVSLTNKSISSDEDISDIAGFWENQWLYIHEEFDNLNTQLSKIVVKTNQYFRELEIINNKIKNPEIRSSQIAKCENVYKIWKNELSDTKDSLERTKLMLIEGDDFCLLYTSDAADD